MSKITRNWQLFIGFVAIWTLVGFSFAGIGYLAMLNENESVSAWTVFSTNLVTFYIWGALSPLIFQIAKRFDFKKGKTLLRGVLVHLLFGFLFSVLHSIIYTGIIWSLDASYRERYSSIVQFFREYVFFGSIYLGLLLYALIVFSIQAFLFYRSYQAEEARNSHLKAQLADARLQALKMQLQPHFLFNTLHSISSLNVADPQKANVMIARLGEFLRLTLEHSDEQMVTLDEEINFLRCYLEIEQIRFSDRLTVEFQLQSETLSAFVPHLLLQPVVENALKHGIAPRAAPGQIVISAKKIGETLLLEVKDNGLGIGSNDSRNGKAKNGTGLPNIRSRLEQIYEGNFRFELANGSRGGLTVIIEIPISFETKSAVLN